MFTNPDAYAGDARQWVISLPFPLRYLFAAHPHAMGKVLGIIYRAISTLLIHKAGYRLKDGATGAVTLIQRFGSALHQFTLSVLNARLSRCAQVIPDKAGQALAA